MIDREYLANLYETYKTLLSDRERSYFEYYYFEDYSLNEIAEVFDVSKAYASKYINLISKKLEDYEKALELYSKSKRIRELLKLIDNNDVKSKIEEIL